MFIGTDFICIQNVFDGFKNLTKDCPCNTACKQTEFSTTISASNWPSESYLVITEEIVPPTFQYKFVHISLEQPIFGARKGYNEEDMNERKEDYLKVS